MKALLLLAALFPLVASAGSVNLTWTPPTANTDGSALTTLSGYKVYFGTQSNSLGQVLTLANPDASGTLVDNLAAGKWFFAVSATATSGSESQPSAITNATVAAAPPPPPPLVTAGPYSYEATGTASTPSMSAIGLVQPGLTCGPAVRQIGTVKFCQITRAQTDLIGWPFDKTLAAGLWAKAQ